MLKLLVFLLVLLLIYYGRRLLTQSKSAASREAQRSGEPERMLSCARCGVHVPQSEGVMRGERFYCCDQHARDDGA